MKGTFFSNEIEYTLSIEGEQWKQGDTVTGSLCLKSHALTDKSIEQTGCFLTLGNSKKIKAKDKNAFSILETVLFAVKQLPAGGSDKIAFSFGLPKDCPLSESTASLYVCCGTAETLLQTGSLRLTVEPYVVINNFLDVFVNFMKFKLKPLKSKNEWVEATLVAPDSKEYTGLEQTKVYLRMNEDNLDLIYKFKVKKLDFTAQATTVKSQNVEVKQTLTPKQHSIYGTAVNQEEIVKHLDTVLAQVRTKSMI